MNYFEWFDIPRSLAIDLVDLKRKFYDKSKQLHPDFHTHSDANAELEVLEQASFNNQAYRTLRDFDERLKYLLTLQGMLEVEGENALPQEFLLEMMELNEAVMDLQMEFQPQKYRQLADQLGAKMEELDSHVKSYLTAPDSNSFTNADWISLRNYYLERRYLYRLRKNFEKTQVK